MEPSPVVEKGAQFTSKFSLPEITRPGVYDEGSILSPSAQNLAIRWRANTVRPSPAMTKGGHTPILNDLKADKFAGVIMGRGLVWLIPTILLFSMLGQSYDVTYSTSEGIAWYDCDDSFASITDSSGTEIANGSDFKLSLIHI